MQTPMAFEGESEISARTQHIWLAFRALGRAVVVVLSSSWWPITAAVVGTAASVTRAQIPWTCAPRSDANHFDVCAQVIALPARNIVKSGFEL